MILKAFELALLIVLRPGRAVAIAFWRITGRRVRARARLKAALSTLPFAYARWQDKCARADRTFLKSLRSVDPARYAAAGDIVVHLHIANEGDAEHAAGAAASLIAQHWSSWRLVVTATTDAAHRLPEDRRVARLPGRFPSRLAGLRAALAEGTGYVVPVRPDCRMPRGALLAYAAHRAMQAEPDLAILYGDQDEMRARGKPAALWFKPEWDAEMFLAQDYLSASSALPVAAARTAIDRLSDVPDEVAVYRLILALALEERTAVEHVDRIVMSVPSGRWCDPCPDRLEMLREAPVLPAGTDVSAGVFGSATIRRPLPDVLPLVSIIVPTRDRVELLRTCVEGVLHQTDYPRIELIIADNDSREPATLAFFDEAAADPRVRIVAWPHPYNYSAINNVAAQSARGTHLCLLNNDIEIIDRAWLREMMRYALRPEAGAVGARLLYPDHSIQHAGVVVGMGNAAGHAHRGLPEHQPGYFANAYVAHRASAVTAACLVVERAKFAAVGGLDETDLRIAYNDVDFCLKLANAGFENYYVPSAVLIHHESKSRGLDTAPEHLARYLQELDVLQSRWNTRSFQDPAHHPVLDRGSETYRPAFSPPVRVAPGQIAIQGVRRFDT